MSSLSSQDYTNIILAAIGIIAFIYKRFIEPRLPAQKAAKTNTDLMTLTQAVTHVVQKIEQQLSDWSPAQRKQQAIKDVQTLLQEIGAPIPSEEVVDGLIESAVWLLNQNKVTAIAAKGTIQTPAAPRGFPQGGSPYSDNP